MVKTWSVDNPKAALMERKRVLIVDAALSAFLQAGYAETSVNQIASDAGVSIKTLYRHFENKADLFSAVMQAACDKAPMGEGGRGGRPHWHDLPLEQAMPAAGREYLRHILSPDQLALYRVVSRDAHRFPELGLRYMEQASADRDRRLICYLDQWMTFGSWPIEDKIGAAQSFLALLKAGIFENALLGLKLPSADEIAAQAERASGAMLLLLEGNLGSPRRDRQSWP